MSVNVANPALNELLSQAIGTLRAMWRRRWIGLAVASSIALLAAVGVARFPERYQATARIYVDTQSVLKPLMTGIAVQPDIDRMVAMVGRTLITRPNVEKLVNDPYIAFEQTDPQAFERDVTRLLNDIKLTTSGRENLFNLEYRDVDAERARRVVQKLVELFVSTGLGDKKRDTEDARRFIDEQIASHEEKLREAESRVKAFKLRNFGFTGASGQDTFARMSSIQDELSRVHLEVRSHTESREALRRQLAGEEPLLPSEGSTSSALTATSDLDPRIDGLRRQLDDLQRRYTEQHPDVLATQRLLQQLEEDRVREMEARRKAGPAAARLSSQSNPVFARLRIALAENEAALAGAQARSAELQGRLDQLRATATKYPQVEAELAQLNRDYEIIRANYQALVARREQAAIAQDVDASSMLADFRIIEPPRVLPRPVMPNRLSLAIAALIASIAAGVATTFALTNFAPTVQSSRMLATLVQRPVLGTVSLLVTPIAARKQRRANWAFTAALLSIFVLYGGWIAWMALIKPMAA